MVVNAVSGRAPLLPYTQQCEGREKCAVQRNKGRCARTKRGQIYMRLAAAQSCLCQRVPHQMAGLSRNKQCKKMWAGHQETNRKLLTEDYGPSPHVLRPRSSLHPALIILQNLQCLSAHIWAVTGILPQSHVHQRNFILCVSLFCFAFLKICCYCSVFFLLLLVFFASFFFLFSLIVFLDFFFFFGIFM